MSGNPDSKASGDTVGAPQEHDDLSDDVGLAEGTIRPDATVRLDSETIKQHVQAQRTGSLLVIDGLHADIGRHLAIEGSVVIGRETEGLQLSDALTSRRHATVEQQGVHYVVRDLESTNGTLVNGQRLTETHRLCDGDTVQLGQTAISFTLVTQAQAAYLRRMDQLAGTDHLTGLPAKHRFDSLLQEALRSSGVTGKPLSLLMMDLDGLKRINDAHGHQMGAETISQVGQLLGRVKPALSEACRFGGDEFCLLLPGHRLAAGMRMGEQICRSVREATVMRGKASVQPTISVGVAECPGPHTSGPELIELADQALYRAKASGRNRVSS